MAARRQANRMNVAFVRAFVGCAVIAATTTHPKVDNEQTTGPIYSHVAVRHNAGLEIHIHFSTVKPSSPAEPLGAVPIGSGGAA
jgi:hypothetical protein